MKKIFFFALIVIGTWLNANASSSANEDKVRQLEMQYNEKITALRSQTLHSVTDVKSLIGKKICLHPNYNERKQDKNLEVMNVKSNLWTNNQDYKKYTVTHDDVLEVLKAKKTELTVQKDADQIKIPAGYFAYFMLKEVRDELVTAYTERETKIKEAIIEQRKEEEVRAAREKAQAEEEQRQAQLKKYWAEVAEFLAAEEGPINTKQERAYDARTPYWKWADKNNASTLETYRDEKFVLSPRRFLSYYTATKKSLSRHPEGDAYKHFVKLEAMQTDTFGIYKWGTFINLRTGDTFGTGPRDDASMSMWESVRHLAYRKDLPAYVYDGTLSMQYFIRQTDDSDADRALEALVGERVFMLDSMKYDVITGFAENLHTSDHVVLFLQKRGRCDNLRKCISVKWFEKLQAMVGKKVLNGSEFAYFEDDKLWKEDIPNLQVAVVDAVEVKDHKLQVTITDHSGTEKVDALEYCHLIACPIDYTAEKENRLAKQRHHELHRQYVSYEAALATMPAKTAAVKKKEAENRAYWNATAKRMDALRQHKLIGKSLGDFLREYKGATLVNTTTDGGTTVKIYRYQDYKLVFRNGWCVSQTTY